MSACPPNHERVSFCARSRKPTAKSRAAATKAAALSKPTAKARAASRPKSSSAAPPPAPFKRAAEWRAHWIAHAAKLASPAVSAPKKPDGAKGYDLKKLEKEMEARIATSKRGTFLSDLENKYRGKRSKHSIDSEYKRLSAAAANAPDFGKASFYSMSDPRNEGSAVGSGSRSGKKTIIYKIPKKKKKKKKKTKK